MRVHCGLFSNQESTMTTKTYTGGCHCGKVRFEAKFDLSAGTGKCNCSICTKARLWGFRVAPEAFRLLSGEADLTDYQFNTHSAHHLFCKHCGVRAFEWADIPQAGGKYYSVQAMCVDDLDVAALLAAPVRYCDGAQDNGWQAPAETRHL
jgi:hypothetical protein